MNSAGSIGQVDGPLVATVYPQPWGNKPLSEQAKINGYLIAAAPDLKWACEYVFHNCHANMTSAESLIIHEMVGKVLNQAERGQI
jgi:hypothetical protein